MLLNFKNITFNRFSKGHDTNRSSKGGVKVTHKCTNCGQTGHQAWARMCPIRQREMKRSKRAYDICSMRYFTFLKNIIEFIEQDNKMSTKNDVVSTNFRIQIQISQFLSQ